MLESAFHPVPSQGSIYSVTRLGNTIILATGNHGKVLCYTVGSKGALEEVTLPDLPNDIEIIALDAFQETCPVLAVTFVHKGGNDSDEHKHTKAGLHIYWTSLPENIYWTSSQSESPYEGFSPKSFSPKSRVKEQHTGESSQLDSIAQHSCRLKLEYIPFHLYHVPVRWNHDDGMLDGNSYGHIFLLTGSDRRVHAFQISDDKNTFTEVSVDKYFPEISKEFESIVTRVQVECLNERTKRISLCGCEDGTLHIWIVSSSTKKSTGENGDDMPESETIEKIEHGYDGMINSIQSFTDGFQFNVIVASACSPTYIYTNTVEDHFTTGVPLKFSSRWDTVETVCVADIDLDGRAEIILGTFGCTMLVYKYMDDILPQWVIVAHKKFPSGILSIQFIDYVIHVITCSGIHVIEYSTSGYFKYGNTISGTIPEELFTPNDDNTDSTEKTEG